MSVMAIPQNCSRAAQGSASRKSHVFCDGVIEERDVTGIPPSEFVEKIVIARWSLTRVEQASDRTQTAPQARSNWRQSHDRAKAASTLPRFFDAQCRGPRD